jgi:hypothetical protein
MRKLFIWIVMNVCHLITGNLHSQPQHDKVWINGAAEVLIATFNKQQVVTQSYIDTSFGWGRYFAHGNSNICDSFGVLQCSSDGLNVYHNKHELMEGGYHLAPDKYYLDEQGFSHYSQTSIMLPVGGQKYYVITSLLSDTHYEVWQRAMNGDSIYFDLLWYHEIDMAANNGLGRVVQSKVPLLENAYLSKPGMMACRHANGRDWWLLKGRYNNTDFHTFLVTSKGFEDKGIQQFPRVGQNYDWDIDGQSMFSADGSMFATVIGHRGTVNLFDFDRCTGILSNQRAIHVPLQKTGNPLDSSEVEFFSTVGVAFSPNQRFLYVAGDFNLLQYDLHDPDSASAWYYIANIDTTWQKFQGYSNLYNGPDGKLYVGNWSGISKQMSVINNPNAKGAACGWCPRCLRFNSVWGGATTPPCMPNYRLGALVGSACDTLNPVPPVDTLYTIKIYPVPANEVLNIELPTKTQSVAIVVYNAMGAVVDRYAASPLLTTKLNIRTASYARGVYHLKISTESGEYFRMFTIE